MSYTPKNLGHVVMRVRDINQAKVFSRREDRRNEFAGRMSET